MSASRPWTRALCGSHGTPSPSRCSSGNLPTRGRAGRNWRIGSNGLERGEQMPELAGWESFYVIVGSSAGALIGLQFVVMTLIADSPIVRDVERASNAFATPTIVHFGSVLMLSAIISAPWHGIAAVAIFWAALGL